MRPVTFDELVDATRGTPVRVMDGSLDFDRIEIDSRRVRPDDVFWAVRGLHHDGHDFIDEAARRGAIACVARSEIAGGLPLPTIAVADTLSALWDFAGHYRRQLDTLVLGVTGSVGKTTTRHMVHAMLSARFGGTESPRNYNNHIGVPLSLLSVEPRHEFAVLEFAASGVGEIRRLAAFAAPEIGLVTSIAPAHLDGFGGIENVCRAKGELIESLPPSGFAVLNGDNDLVRRLASRARCPVILVGERAHNDVIASRVEATNEEVRFRVDGSEFRVTAAGRHHLTSALLAVAVGREVGMHDEEIIAGLAGFRAVAGRSRPERIGDWTVIDDTYNASPASMHAACETLQNWQGANQRVMVVGDMLALGDRADEFHSAFGGRAAAAGLDGFIAVGAHATTVVGSAKRGGMDTGRMGACADLETAMTLLDCWLEPGDVVLVKGSRDMRMEQFLERLRSLADQRSEHKQRHAA